MARCSAFPAVEIFLEGPSVRTKLRVARDTHRPLQEEGGLARRPAFLAKNLLGGEFCDISNWTSLFNLMALLKSGIILECRTAES